MKKVRFSLFNHKLTKFRSRNYLYCSECGYVHPEDAGLEEGDICPDCGRGILIEI